MKPHHLLDQIRFESICDGKSIQMLHIGSYDNEPKSFEQMENYSKESNLARKSKIHREIYLSDFRKVPEEKLKTVLRFQVNPKA
ncbi:GyrI-like domain-containing protein [Sediminitomix flava]|uniref:GyrI-like small molecule binding protein n=1 Tax=Sediminitomix flava TaxID=379075 RepID=A0A315ZD34_SEDFL|nr:GyrI-like domain-containing protein [Sediminitomix flava]PWJ43202.1 GyrI-like small molecule binding protein [Sediminitomix flava]